MSTILIHRYGTISRRCDSTCHTAKHTHCACLCGGLCHGIGHQAAVEALFALLQTRPDAFDDCEISPLELTPEFQWDYPLPEPKGKPQCPTSE
jgi:hypothetical protein